MKVKDFEFQTQPHQNIGWHYGKDNIMQKYADFELQVNT